MVLMRACCHPTIPVLGLLCVALLSAPAAGQAALDGPVTDDPEQHFQAGRDLLKADRTLEAVNELRAALSLAPERGDIAQTLLDATRRTRTVTVLAAVSPAFRAQDGWEDAIRRRLRFANEHLRPHGIALELADPVLWQPALEMSDGLSCVDELMDDIPRGQADVVIGFVRQEIPRPRPGEAPERRLHTVGLGPSFSGYAVICDYVLVDSVTGLKSRMREPFVLETFVHEMGHLFGCVHVSANSCMRSGGGPTPQYDYDPENAAVLGAARWVDFRRQFASFAVPELERLADAYEALRSVPRPDKGCEFYLACTYQLLGDLERAARLYEVALNANPADPFAQLNLARIYAEQGYPDRATEHFQAVIAIGEPAYMVQRAREELLALGG